MENGGHLLPNKVVFDEVETPERILSYVLEQANVLRCPNCRAVIVEDADGIHFLLAATEPPRLYVDRADRDVLGGFGVRSARSLAEAHIETWVDENDNLDPTRMVACID